MRMTVCTPFSLLGTYPGKCKDTLTTCSPQDSYEILIPTAYTGARNHKLPSAPSPTDGASKSVCSHETVIQSMVEFE